MYSLAEFLTSLYMDVVTEISGDLLNVFLVYRPSERNKTSPVQV